MSILKKWLINILLGCLVASGSMQCYAEKEHSPESEAIEFVESVKDRIIKAINNNSDSEQEKQAAIEKIFLEIIDIEWLGKYALGRFNKTLTIEQKRQFKVAYTRYLINHYVPKFKKFNGQIMEIKKVTQTGPNQYEIKTSILTEGKPTIEIKYSVVEKDYHKFYIYDLVTEGVSLAATQHTEFSNIITRKGFEYLLEKLTEKQS